MIPRFHANDEISTMSSAASKLAVSVYKSCFLVPNFVLSILSCRKLSVIDFITSETQALHFGMVSVSLLCMTLKDTYLRIARM